MSATTNTKCMRVPPQLGYKVLAYYLFPVFNRLYAQKDLDHKDVKITALFFFFLTLIF